MDPVMLVLRFVHIVAGAMWFGSAFLFTIYVGPSAAEVGPSAGPLMSVLVKKRRVTRTIVGLILTTVIAGWLMWLVELSRYGSLGDWVGSRFGLVITIGAILATIAAYVGIAGVARTIERRVELGDSIREAGGPPTPEQAGRLQELGVVGARYGRTVIVLLIVAVGAMATARYW